MSDMLEALDCIRRLTNERDQLAKWFMRINTEMLSSHDRRELCREDRHGFYQTLGLARKCNGERLGVE